uniref:Uncharacterized protein n=1 Tax=Clandestinovirus TaxID=2831644 RepID=A0A8F8KQK0_9VIRU|nr:hypothetical protein KOM_12_94 [Clandestinovirus]
MDNFEKELYRFLSESTEDDWYEFPDLHLSIYGGTKKGCVRLILITIDTKKQNTGLFTLFHHHLEWAIRNRDDVSSVLFFNVIHDRLRDFLLNHDYIRSGKDWIKCNKPPK